MALAVTLQTVQVMATTYEECTAKTEMVLSVYSFERYSKTHTHTENILKKHQLLCIRTPSVLLVGRT